MARKSYRKSGIAAVSGDNLDSVKNSLDISGLYPVKMANGGTPETPEQQIQQHINLITGTPPSLTPTLEELGAAQDIYSSYLGDSGYEQERARSQQDAKLQAYLALANAGFNLMGAQPQPGQTGLSMVGQHLGAPLAANMSNIAATFAERDAARRAAQRAEERQIKLQAFQDVTSRKQAAAERYAENRKSAWDAISRTIDFVDDQQTLIDNVWTDVGQIRRVMTGPFKNIPKYYNATTGEEITTPIRNYRAPDKGYQDKIAKLDKVERWISQPTTEDRDAGYWVETPAYTLVTFNKDGSRNTSSTHFFGDNADARFEDQRIRDADGAEVTVTANARFAADAKDRKQGRLGHVKELVDGKPTGPVVPINYTYDENQGYTVLGLGDDADPVILAGPNPTHVLVNEKGEVVGADVGTEDDYETPRFVVKISDDGSYSFPDPKNIVQVRQTKDRDNPINIRTLKPYTLGQNEVILKYSELPESMKGVVDTEDDVGVYDAGKAQQWVMENGKLVLGPVIDTKVKEIDGVLTQVRIDTDEAITIGNEKGEYKLYEKPGEATAAEEEKDREYQGALSSLPRYLDRGAILSQREDALNYGIEGFTYNGVPLNDDAQNIVRDYFRNVYDNIMGTIRVGMGVSDVQDLTRKFAEQFFNTPITAILNKEEITGVESDAAIPQVPLTEIPSVVTPEHVYRPHTRDRKIALENYTNLGKDFARNAAKGDDALTAWEVMGSGDILSMPYHAAHASNPVARVSLMAKFMPHVWANPYTHSDSTDWQNNQAGRNAIHNRILFEQVANDPSVTSKQRDLNDRDAALRTEVTRRKEELSKKIDSKESRELRTEVLPNTVAMLELVNDLESTLLRIDPTGFIKGGAGSWLASKGLLNVPIGNAIEMLYTGTVSGSVEQEVGDLYREFLSKANILTELGGRSILKASGDERYSDKDMEGAKKVLVKLNQSGDMNLANLQELRGYLLNSLDANLTGIGTIGLTDETIIRALKVGGSLEGVMPSKYGAWSPFVRENYAVTRNQTPGYDRNTVEQWNTQAALEGTLKDGVYWLPLRQGNTPWGDQATPVNQEDLFETNEDGRYIHQKLIDNYIWWRNSLRPTQFGSQ